MLSSTGSSKSKSFHNTEGAEGFDRVDLENTVDDKVRGYVGCYDGSSSYGRLRGRGRVSEFRHSRGSRGAFRGRGGDGPKYLEAASPKPHDGWSFSTSKYDKPDIALNLPEDPRISKLLRRLCSETDIEKSLTICSKLQDAVMMPENSRYIRRSYDILVESLLDVWYDGPGQETKEGAAIVLGRIGFVMGPDFEKHMEWAAATYRDNNNAIKHLIALSLIETFQMDVVTPSLGDSAECALAHLQVMIEVTSSAEVFIASINAMIILSNSYPEDFANHFVDVVDYLVGWHVDNSKPKIKEFILQSLFMLSRHWQADVDFSINLLNHFVEDMIRYSCQESETNEEESVSEDNIQKVTSFINVFNIVIKSLDNLLRPNMPQAINFSFLNESLTKVLQVISTALKTYLDTELLLAGNECITLLLEYLQVKSSSRAPQLYALISLEIHSYLQIDNKVCFSIINLIVKTIRVVSSNLSLEFITEIIGKESLLRPLRYSDDNLILQAIIAIYSNLLNLKNIPLLQKTYEYVLSDLQIAFSTIIPDADIIKAEYVEEMLKIEPEKNIIFYFQGLSELANASNSIIGMWALKPSIVELLAVKMCPDNDILINKHSALHYAILYLLYSHCRKNNHFIESSNLVSNVPRAREMFTHLSLEELSNTSPTSGHLAVILNLLSVVLEKELSGETLIFILKWIHDILLQLQKHFADISLSKGFLILLTNMLALGHTFENEVVVLVLKNSRILLRNKSLSWNIILLKTIASLALLHIDNNNQIIHDLCLEVLFDLPWDVVQTELDSQQIPMFLSPKITINVLNGHTKLQSLKDYFVRGSHNALSTEHFKLIINNLLELTFNDKSGLQSIFLTSWPLQNQMFEGNNIHFFRQCAMSFLTIFNGWILSELAQTCILLKLRTPLGKPQETFMKIERALKEIARETSSQDTEYWAIDDHSLWDVVEAEQTRSRSITEFMVLLEKYIYNAAEGTAMVLPTSPKPVKTFFHTNWTTCRDWFSRIRPAALAVSLYSGHYGAAICHGELILQTAAASNSNIDIDAITMIIAKAIIKLQEPEILHGFYVWIQQTFNKKLHWLKAAAEQANSRYEISIDYYKKLKKSLVTKEDDYDDNSEFIKTDNPKLNKFLDEQIIECYKHIQNWEDMNLWLEGEYSDKFAYLKPFTFINSYDTANIDINGEFSNWDILDKSSKQINKHICSHQGLINIIESSLIDAAIKIYRTENYGDVEDILNVSDLLLNSNMMEFSQSSAIHFMKDLSVLKLANQGLKDTIKNGKNIQNPFKPATIKEHKFGTSLENLCRLLWWNEYFTKLNVTEENIYYMECLRLDVIKSARKNTNKQMAKRELLRHFKGNANIRLFLGDISNLDELSEILTISTNTYDLDIWTYNNTTAFVELCKLTYESEEIKMKAIDLCASVSLGFSQRLAMGEQSYELREKGTRMLLTLSKWVQNENETVVANNLNSPLNKLITALPEIGLVDNKISENVIPVTDSAVGKLLQFSVNQCPGLAKAWSNFASWCFRWGRKMVEYSSNTGEQLTESDKQQIKNVMIGCSPKDFDAVCEILSKTKATYDDEEIDWSEINTSEMIENQLRTVPSLNNAYPDHLALLVDIWKQAQKRVFSYFELSADAYFKFLQLICAADYINHSGEYAVVSATLRLLRLIVKHAMELQTVLESGLANTPTHPWKVIIPQLFSRLNHPETYVRKCVSDLLCRLAEDTPHLITFPAVVGSVENQNNDIMEFNTARNFLTNDVENVAQEQDLDDSSSDKVVNTELNSCFLDMVETLSKQAPTTILQVKLLVKELQRINLLWDELWLGTLVQNHSDFSKRLTQLDAEITKVKKNINLTEEDKTYLIKEKHRIIFEPIVYVIEQLNHITSANPETPHEIAFQTKFLTLIEEVIDKLKNPPNPENPYESYAPLKQLQLKLNQRVNKRTSYVLKMSDISPILAELKHTVITMPGVHTTQRTVRVTIRSVENCVVILPTKTRPKKLVFCGSDGKSYTYLFKGLEDLHLDERIMQLLSIVNTMMARDSENDLNQTYRARHYSVIPLGPRSGLISWVDNVTPLFTLYKRWQMREAAILSTKTNKPVTVLRPSELFYNKLTPLLEEAGVSYDNRKEWPVSVLKRVLQELVSETPKDLLWREFWCGSISPEHWWRTVRRYSYSLAVMSTIGYIIGLGDRHLDNVLVDLSSGEVVHIDYNVCFEKGKTLRVPEKVPFRMTQNLVTALGVTGVEGIFRLSCEHVLRVMRRGRETLLTLLEAFVYDPLVEWGGSGGGRRRRTQRDVRAALAMLAVRAQELKHDIAQTTEQFTTALPEVISKIDVWVQETDNLASIEAKLQDCHQQMALVKEIEAYGQNLSSHPLYAISQKYSSYKQAKNALEESERTLAKLLKHLDAQIENFAAANEIMNGPQLLAWVQEFSTPNEDDDQPIFENITEFLTNAGQTTMLVQCEQAEAELKQYMKQTKALVRSCLELLSHHVAVSQYFPQSQTEYHRALMLRKWVAAALETTSPDVCKELSKQVMTLKNLENMSANASQEITEYNNRLQVLVNEATENLNKAYERMQLEGGAEAMAKANETYREAKANVSNWLRTEEGGLQVLETVVMGKLCSLNSKFLMLESRAQSAGDCLVDLTSREGEWFLDEMCALSMQAVELLSLLPLQPTCAEDATLPIAVECVRSANMMLADLVQLNYNFCTIILPEAMKKVHSEDPSTLVMINEVNNIITSSPIPLNELLAQLEIHLRYLVMEMESPAGGCQLMVAELRAKYEGLLSSGEDGQSSGRMLLMGFDGLFASVELRWREMAEHLSTPLSPVWRKIDQIIESTRMCGVLTNGLARGVVEDMMFVRRVQAVAEVLAAAVSSAAAASIPAAAPPDPQPTRPIRRVTAEIVSRCLLGVHSRALASAVCMMLHRAGVDLGLQVEQKEIGASWSVSLESMCQHVACPAPNVSLTAGRVADAVTLGRRSLERLAAVRRSLSPQAAHRRGAVYRLAAHRVLHARVLNGSNTNVETSKLLRRSKELTAAADRLAAAHAKTQNLVASAHQRLRWGAGANPSLSSLVGALEAAWGAAGAACAPLRSAAAALSTAARALTTTVTTTSLIRDRHKACALATRHRLAVSAAEEALMEMLHPEGNIDAQWVSTVGALLGEMIASLTSQITSSRQQVLSAAAAADVCRQEALVDAGTRFAGVLVDVVPSLAVLGGRGSDSPAARMLARIEQAQELLRPRTRPHDAAHASRLLLRQVAALLADLLQIHISCSADGGRGSRQNAPNNKNNKTGPAGWAAGAGVWKRVRLKLEARRYRHLTDQVDHIISEAMSTENLCTMYEGWMAWV